MPVPTRHVFIPTKGVWTLFVENYGIGTDADGPMMMLSQLLRTEGLRVVMREERTNAETGRVVQYAATILVCYSMGSSRRSITCIDDGGRWVFETTGSPYHFEQLDAYQAKRVKDRFNKRLLLEYLRHLGVGDLGDELCVPGPGSPAYLVEREEVEKEWGQCRLPPTEP
jgi:hypothetical protein